MHGHLDLVGWLLQQLECGMVDSDDLEYVVARGGWWPLSSTLLSLQALIDKGRIDVDLDPTSPSTSQILQHAEEDSLKLILEKKTCPPTLSVVEGVFEQLSHRRSFITPTTFLRLLGLETSSPRLATLETKGFSVVHFAAKMLANAPRVLDTHSASAQGWLDLASAALANGAQPSNIAHIVLPRQYNRFLYGTPFFNLVAMTMAHDARNNQGHERFLDIVQSWLHMIQRSGLDLLEYGKQEDLAWRIGQDKSFAQLPYLGQVYFHFKSGETPEAWDISVSQSQAVPLYRLEQMPGTFKDSIDVLRVPKQLCWVPQSCDRGDYTWRHVEDKFVWQEPRSALELFLEYWQIPTLDRCTAQDDSTPVILMETGSRQHIEAKRRSASVPPNRRSQMYKYEKTDAPIHYALKLPPWHSGIHFCTNTMAHEFGDQGYCGIRECANGLCQSDVEPGAQMSLFWKNGSFLAEIRNCLDGLPIRNAIPYGLRHTGTRSCPQGCANIKLDELHVPEPLREHHPRRHTDERWDETE